MIRKLIISFIMIALLAGSASAYQYKCDFKVNHVSGWAPLGTEFTGTTTCPSKLITSWSWNFIPENGDYSQWDWVSSHPVTAKHTFVNPGKYFIILSIFTKAGDSNAVAQMEKHNYITVYGCDFTADHTLASFRTPINFRYTGGTAGTATFAWNFGDKTTSPMQNPVHQYAKPGKYTVTLTVKDSKIGSKTITKTNYIQIV